MSHFNMNLQENIQRIREMMGLLTEDVENNDCYPSDYEPGKMYERDDLAKMFYCFADGKFPLEWIKESQFPKLPPFGERKEYISPKYDPKNMQIGKDEFVTMPEFVELNTKNIEVKTENLKITPNDFHPETLNFIPKKMNAEGYENRVKTHKKRVTKDGVYSLSKEEPFVVEFIDGKYKLEEGWHRMLALYELYTEGKIPYIEGKAFVIKKSK